MVSFVIYLDFRLVKGCCLFLGMSMMLGCLIFEWFFIRSMLCLSLLLKEIFLVLVSCWLSSCSLFLLCFVVCCVILV